MAIAITRSDMTAVGLRSVSAKCRDAQASRRMLALALVPEGVDRTTAAETCGLERQTPRDRVPRSDAEGVAGLTDRRGASRPARPGPAQVAGPASWVEAGPDPAADGVVGWRRQDPRARIGDGFGVGLHGRTVGKDLTALGYRRLSVRSRHPKTDPEARETLKRTSAKRQPRRFPRRRGTGRSRSGSRTRRGSGNKARSPASGPGAAPGRGRRATPDTNGPASSGRSARPPGAAAGPVMPFADTPAMNAHPAEITRTVAPGAHAVLVLDGAGWHGGHDLT